MNNVMTKLFPAHAALAAELEQAGFEHTANESASELTLNHPLFQYAQAASSLRGEVVRSSSPSLPSVKDQVQLLQNRVAALQHLRFPQGTVAGLLTHLRKETSELFDAPTDLMEWADVFILYLAAAWRAGHDVSRLVALAHTKMAVNENRAWPAVPDADGVYQHQAEVRPPSLQSQPNNP